MKYTVRSNGILKAAGKSPKEAMRTAVKLAKGNGRVIDIHPDGLRLATRAAGAWCFVAKRPIHKNKAKNQTPVICEMSSQFRAVLGKKPRK